MKQSFIIIWQSEIALTIIVPSPPCFLWKASISEKGNVQITSAFNTKKGSPSFKRSRAKAKGPAVPNGSVSCE